MTFPCHFLAAALCAAACVAPIAHADSLDGSIDYHNDVIYHSFILERTSDLTVWTDSYLNGVNFDPIVGVWHNGTLVGQNDDNPTIARGQTAYDSGLRFSDLAAGTYVFTISAYDNFANGTRIDEGFRFDGETPIPLTEWCEPASHCNMGPLVKLNWTTGVVPSVPEPSTSAMLGAGLGLLGVAARRRRHMPTPPDPSPGARAAGGAPACLRMRPTRPGRRRSTS